MWPSLPCYAPVLSTVCNLQHIYSRSASYNLYIQSMNYLANILPHWLRRNKEGGLINISWTNLLDKDINVLHVLLNFRSTNCQYHKHFYIYLLSLTKCTGAFQWARHFWLMTATSYRMSLLCEWHPIDPAPILSHYLTSRLYSGAISHDPARFSDQTTHLWEHTRIK